MAEFRGAKQQERPTSSVRPARERMVQKQLVSIRHGAIVNELVEEQTKGGGILQQRAAVRFVSEDAVPHAPAFTVSRFAHDFSRVPAHTISFNSHAPLIQRRPSAPSGSRYKLEVDLSSAKLTVRQGSTVAREVNILSGGATWTLIRAGRNVTTGKWKYKAKAFRIKRFYDEFVIRPKSHPDYTACTWFPWGKELDSFPTAPGRPPSTVKPPKGTKEYPVRVKATGEKQIRRDNGRWETIEQYCNPFGAHWAVIKGQFMLHGTDGNPGDTSGTPRERRTFTHGCIRTDNNTVKWLKGIINNQGGARLLIKP